MKRRLLLVNECEIYELFGKGGRLLRARDLYCENLQLVLARRIKEAKIKDAKTILHNQAIPKQPHQW